MNMSHQIQKEKQEHPSEVQQTEQTNLYYHSILCNPYLLDNPASTDHSFMHDLFLNKQITKVKRTKDFLTVDIKEKSKSDYHNVMENYQFKDAEIQNQLKNTYTIIGGIISKSCQQNKKLRGQNYYTTWLNQSKNKSIIGWFLSHCDSGIKLRSFSMSANLLKILDYKIDELALDIQHLGAQAIDVIDGQIYKASFFMILNTIRKFNETLIKGQITRQQIIKQSQSFIINEMKGRGNKKITVQTKIYMPSEFMVCFQVVRVLDQKEVRDNKRKINRQNAIKKVQELTYSCLSRVARLPKSINPQNSSKICSYIEIKPIKNTSSNKVQKQKDKEKEYYKQDDKKLSQTI